jgi:hypothetical protein
MSKHLRICFVISGLILCAGCAAKKADNGPTVIKSVRTLPPEVELSEQDSRGIVVYASPADTRFHTKDCTVRLSFSLQPITLDSALRKYEPCGLCGAKKIVEAIIAQETGQQP